MLIVQSVQKQSSYRQLVTIISDIKEGYIMTIIRERELETMPFDKAFEVAEGRQELCHATGKEVCFADGNPDDPADWWIEYQDRDGNYHYGR